MRSNMGWTDRTIRIVIALAIGGAYFAGYLNGWLALVLGIVALAFVVTSAIGAIVDASIVIVEQTHKRLEEWSENGQIGDARSVVIRAVKEVAVPTFWALLVIAVSFLPIIALEGEEGRMFRPLAWTKTITVIIAALLAVTLDPALRLLLMKQERKEAQNKFYSTAWKFFTGGQVSSEDTSSVSRHLVGLYRPVVKFSLDHGWIMMAAAVLLIILTIPVWLSLGTEFMPPLDEGTILYMPTTKPGISIAEAKRLLQGSDQIIKTFPEVEMVFGKAGRIETATDPAPLSMLETTITLKPKSKWRKVETWYSKWSPELLKPLFRLVTDDTVSREWLINELDRSVNIPGVSNSWTMPIRGRIDMLATGIKTPLGLKVRGADPQEIDRISRQIAALLAPLPQSRNVYAERLSGVSYLDIKWQRDKLAQYGLKLQEAQETIAQALGGETVATAIEGRARYPISVRYLRDFRSDPEAVKQILISGNGGSRQIPLGEVATVEIAPGYSMLRDEEGLLSGYVYIDPSGRDLTGYIEKADRSIKSHIQLPAGYSLSWSGQRESIERTGQKLLWVVPLVLLIITGLLYLNTRSLTKTMIILLAVPFSAIGAIWLLWFLDYQMSVGVWVGLIALLGVDAETGVFMLLYLDLSYEDAKNKGQMLTRRDLRNAVLHGAAQRLRPKVMTAIALICALLPILWATGTGADLMKRIAAPMLGGIVTSFLLELLIYPVIFEMWKWKTEVRELAGEEVEEFSSIFGVEGIK